jgi:large subunit ribosomal protein L15
MQRRLPKFGFKNVNRTEYVAINLDRLQALNEKTGLTDITPEVLYQNGLIKKSDLVKILATGELKAKLNVTAHGCSAVAKSAIEAAGGTMTVA